MDRRVRLWWLWMIAVTAGVALFGASLLLLPVVMRGALNALYFPPPAGPPAMSGQSADYVSFVSGVLGAVMLGWAAMLCLVLAGPFRRGEAEAWRMLVISLAVWFVPDTVFSLAAGFWRNAVLNAVIAVLFAIPLVATWRSLAVSGTAGVPGE